MSSLVLALTGCSADLSDTAQRAAAPKPPAISATAPDGFPNVNVDTARMIDRPRSPEEQAKLERDLLALGRRTDALGRAGKADSVVDELKILAKKNQNAPDLDRSAPPQP